MNSIKQKPANFINSKCVVDVFKDRFNDDCAEPVVYILTCVYACNYTLTIDLCEVCLSSEKNKAPVLLNTYKIIIL